MAKKRILHIGIDGATFDLMRPWMEEGQLPNLNNIAKNGTSGSVLPPFPPTSASSWPSFMTGMNPGKHGLFGFTRVDPHEGYGIKVNSGAVRNSQTAWQWLSEQGRRSIVINMPMTYPPEPINGLVVTGIDTPGLESQFTYPPELREEIIRLIPDYILDVRSWGVTSVGERRTHLLEDILLMVESRKQLALHLMKKEAWDLFSVVFTATDRAQHFFWRFLDSKHPLYEPAEADKYHDAILRVYRRIDQAIGEMLSYCGEETVVIIMSDHGFGPQHKLFRINQWLIEKGFLHLTNTAGKGPIRALQSAVRALLYRGLDNLVGVARSAISDTTKDRLKQMFPRLRERVASEILFSGVDWSRTLAYHTAEFPGSLRVNMKGREMNGIVEPGAEYEAVYEAIRSGLENYKDPETGRNLVNRVYRREEIYWGPNLEKAPDLIVQLVDDSYTFDWYIPVVRNGNKSALPVIDALSGQYAANCGSHRLEGILMLYGESIRRGVVLEPAQIYDVMPTAIYLLGLPVPAEMDGKVLTKAIKAELLKSRPVVMGDSMAAPGEAFPPDGPYSNEEAEAVAHRLRDLGYL